MTTAAKTGSSREARADITCIGNHIAVSVARYPGVSPFTCTGGDRYRQRPCSPRCVRGRTESVLKLDLPLVVAHCACGHTVAGDTGCSGILPCSVADEATQQARPAGTFDPDAVSGHRHHEGAVALPTVLLVAAGLLWSPKQPLSGGHTVPAFTWPSRAGSATTRPADFRRPGRGVNHSADTPPTRPSDRRHPSRCLTPKGRNRCRYPSTTPR
jgi:hypothetical protein